MEGLCQTCGGRFEARRRDAKYCSDNCRKRARRKSEVDPGAERPVVDLVEVVRRDLRKADKEMTPAGQAALIVAHRMTVPQETGGAVTSLSRELTRLLNQAIGKAADDASTTDEVKNRRDQKRKRAQAG